MTFRSEHLNLIAEPSATHRLRPSMYDLESGRDQAGPALLNCDCEVFLDSADFCAVYTVVAVSMSVLFIAFFVLLRLASVGTISYLTCFVPIYVFFAVLLVISFIIAGKPYLYSDEGLEKQQLSVWLVGISGVHLSVGLFVVGITISTIFISKKLDQGAFQISYLDAVIPVIAAFVLIFGIVICCLKGKVIQFSIGIYHSSARNALYFTAVLICFLIATIVLIALRADRNIQVSMFIVFIPLLVFHAICIMWSFATVLKECMAQKDLSSSTSSTGRRLVDCCSLFAYVTPELSAAFPLLLFSFNFVIVEVLIATAVDGGTSNFAALLLACCLPVTGIFLLTCTACNIFVSHNPYAYNFD